MTQFEAYAREWAMDQEFDTVSREQVESLTSRQIESLADRYFPGGTSALREEMDADR